MCRPILDQWMRNPEFRELTNCFSTGLAGERKPPTPSIVVGIAVRPENFEKIRAANGLPQLADVPPDQDAKEFELHFERTIELDILTSREPNGTGAIARFLEKFGEGIQQVEVYVRDVNRAMEVLRDQFGLAPIYPTTRRGANGTRVNFFLAPAPDGRKVLIELVESPSAPQDRA